MISARRRSRQLAMNRTSVAKNSRNSVKVGDRNSTVGWTQSNFGIWNDAVENTSDPPSMLCSCRHSASGRSNSMEFFPEQRSQLRQARAPLHQGRRDQADDEGDTGADRGHDQNRRHRAGNSTPLEKSGGRRQHGADHECRHDREKERFRGVENGDDADDQKRDQRKGDDLRAANNRRQFALAVGQRRTCRFFWKRTLFGEDTQLALRAR